MIEHADIGVGRHPGTGGGWGLYSDQFLQMSRVGGREKSAAGDE